MYNVFVNNLIPYPDGRGCIVCFLHDCDKIFCFVLEKIISFKNIVWSQVELIKECCLKVKYVLLFCLIDWNIFII